MESRTVTLADISIGNTGNYGIGASAVDFSQTLPTYLRITDINDDGTLNKSGLKSVDDPNSFKYQLKPNDIVFARTGASTGRNYFYDGKDGQFVYAGFLIKFSIDPVKAYPKFIKYVCLSQEYNDWVRSQMTGSTRGNMNAQQFGKLPIKLPSLETQRKIAAILSAIDDKIELNNRMNENLEEEAFCFFKKKFPKFRNNEKTIGDFIIPSRGKNLLSKDFVSGNIPVVAGGLEPAGYHSVANTKSPVLTISASGANSGFVALWNSDVWSSDSSYIDSNMTENVYFWYVMLKIRQKEIFDSQTGSAQPHIYPQHIANLPMCDLPLSEVQKFNLFVSPLFLKIASNKKENKRLAELRDALLPKLMSGEIDVSKVEVD